MIITNVLFNYGDVVVSINSDIYFVIRHPIKEQHGNSFKVVFLKPQVMDIVSCSVVLVDYLFNQGISQDGFRDHIIFHNVRMSYELLFSEVPDNVVAGMKNRRVFQIHYGNYVDSLMTYVILYYYVWFLELIIDQDT